MWQVWAFWIAAALLILSGLVLPEPGPQRAAGGA